MSSTCRNMPGPTTCAACLCYLHRLNNPAALCTCGHHNWPTPGPQSLARVS